MLQIKARPDTLEGEYDWVFPGDPALDSDHDEFERKWAHADEVCDYGDLPVKPNQRPSYFTLRHLTADEAAFLRDYISRNGTNQALRLACRLALLRISDLLDERGKPVDLKRAPDGAAGGRDLVLQKYIDLLDEIRFVGPDGETEPGLVPMQIGARVFKSLTLSGK